MAGYQIIVVPNNLIPDNDILIQSNNIVYKIDYGGFIEYFALYTDNATPNPKYYISLVWAGTEGIDFGPLSANYNNMTEIPNDSRILKNNIPEASPEVAYNSENKSVNFDGSTLFPLPLSSGAGMEGGGMGGGGAGAGSDPYITTFSGYTFELPHLNKHWELFSHKPTDFSIIAHTHNYPQGNYFNEIKVNYGKSKITIDYQKKKITTNNSAFKIGKTELTIKYNKKGKIIDETKLFDCIVLNHTEFKEVALIINWRNHYFHPVFQIKPTKNCYGLLMMKEPSKTL